MRGDRRTALALVAISALALALRLYRLDFQSLWSDEIFSLWMAGDSLPESLERVRRDVHPPLYFFALHVWVAIFGHSEFSVRLLSALPSALSVPLLFGLGRRLLGARAGLTAALICAVSTFQIYYAQETRSYALMSLLAIVSMDALTRWRAERTSGSWLYYVVGTTALLYTHYFGIFIVVWQNAWLLGDWLISRRESPARVVVGAPNGLRGWLVAQATVAALLAVWLPVLGQQAQLVGGGFWIEQPEASSLLRTLQIAISLQPPPWGFWIAWPPLLRNFTVLAIGFAAAALLWTRFTRKLDAPSAGSHVSGSADGELLSAAVLLLGWLVVPALMALALGAFSIDVYTHRNLIGSSPALFLLIGAGLARLPGRVLAAIGLAAALAPSLTLYPWYFGAVHKTQWRQAAAWLAERATPADGFVFDAPFIRRNYDFYRGAGDYHFVDVRRRRKPTQERIWLVRAHQPAEERRIQQAVEAWGFVADPPQRFRDIEVFLYEPE